MDCFFTQKYCDRCGGTLEAGRIMSMFNTDCLCLTCKEQEKNRPDYPAAVKAEHEAVKKGNTNFNGIKGKTSQ